MRRLAPAAAVRASCAADTRPASVCAACRPWRSRSSSLPRPHADAGLSRRQRRCSPSCSRPVLAATALVVRRRLGHLDRLELALASVVVGTGILIAVHLVPLMLGILTRGTVLVGAAIAVGLAALVKPVFAFARPHRREERTAPPPSLRPSWVLAGLAGAFATVTALADLGRWAGDELVGVDPLTFHLPNVGRWIQAATMWQIDQFVPLLAHGNYPNNGDVVLLSTVLPWHNDFLVRLPITFFLVTTAIAVFAVARELRAPLAACVLAAAVVVSLPVVGIATIPRALPDSLMWTTFACGVLFLLRHARSRRARTSSSPAWRSGSPPTRSGTASARWRSSSCLARRPASSRGGRRGGRGAARGGADRRRPRRRPVAAGHPALAARNLRSPTTRSSAQGRPVRITIFDAPPDVIRDQVGFTIADYAGHPTSSASSPARSSRGWASRRSSAACARRSPSARAAPRRAPDLRVRPLAGAAVALGLLYTVTPATALGLRGDPSLAHANTRYAVPALLIAAAGRGLGRRAAAAAPRAPARGGARRRRADRRLPRLRGGRVARRRPRDRRARRPRGGGWLLCACAHGVVLAAAAVAAAVVGLAAAHRIEGAINDGRYLGIDRAVDTLLRVAPPRPAHRPGRRLVRRRPVAGLARVRHANRQRRAVRGRVRRRLPHPLSQRGAPSTRPCATAATTRSWSAAASPCRRHPRAALGAAAPAGARSRSARACGCSSRRRTPQR